MSTYPNPSSGLEALLREVCRRAMGVGLSFTNQIRLYRSILALAREVRLRFGSAMPDAAGQTLSALLGAVCEHAAELGLDPELPLPDSLLLQRITVQLSRAARLARVGEPIERAFLAHHAMHREEPAPPEAAEPPAADLLPQHLMHRETEADDAPLTAWRNNHRTDRDQRAHEKLHTAIDDRLVAKVKAMNLRDREERAAAA